MNNGKRKILFIASSGGHWEELMGLKEIADNNNSVFITEKGGQVKELSIPNIYLFSQINRKEIFFLLHFLFVSARAIVIILKEKPDVVITTGALLAYPFCMLAKIMRKKVIFIESLARVTNASLTGKLIYPYADLFIVQWESMLKVYPKAVYRGSVL